MTRKSTFALLGAGLVGLGLYGFRRKLFARLLGLKQAGFPVVLEKQIAIPMRDGVRLAADHYAPQGKHLFPTILIRTPYGRGISVGLVGELSTFIAQRFAERGYNVLVQDVRGRFSSEGEFEPYVNEANDGLDTLEWIERQPWYNGKLGMWGQSYVGYVQWALALQAPGRVQALMPSVTGTNIPNAGLRDGVLGFDTLLRWVFELDAMDRQGAFSHLSGLAQLSPQLSDRKLERAFSHLPLIEADQQAVGRTVPFYRKWLSHFNGEDPYWQAIDLHSRLPEITASVHLTGGWYDIFLRETVADYLSLQRLERSPYLTIGPWRHVDLEVATETLREGLIWFDAHLKGDFSRLRKAPVSIYIMQVGSYGPGEWREMESWPPATRPVELHLQDHGRLERSPAGEYSQPSRYIYDPADPTPVVGGSLMNWHAGPRDNRRLEARPDVLTYTTSPLGEDLEVIGAPRLRLYVKTSHPYVDLIGRLCVVSPTGESLNLCDGFLRLKPGDGDPQPDGSLRLEIELWPTANRFLKGTAIRLQISSGAFPRWNRNLGSGEPIATGTRLVPCEVTIFQDARHPSTLTLPVSA